jgi:hypothetical protein
LKAGFAPELSNRIALLAVIRPQPVIRLNSPQELLTMIAKTKPAKRAPADRRLVVPSPEPPALATSVEPTAPPPAGPTTLHQQAGTLVFHDRLTWLQPARSYVVSDVYGRVEEHKGRGLTSVEALQATEALAWEPMQGDCEPDERFDFVVWDNSKIVGLVLNFHRNPEFADGETVLLSLETDEHGTRIVRVPCDPERFRAGRGVGNPMNPAHPKVWDHRTS